MPEQAVVIAGIGEAPPSSAGSGRLAEAMLLESVEGACLDAGIATTEVDAILAFSHDTAMSVQALAATLRCDELRMACELPFGGGSPSMLLTMASALIRAGVASTVLCQRTIVGDDWVRRMTLPDEVRPYYLDTVNYLRPVGWTGYLHNFGAMFSEHSARYGTTRATLGHIAGQLRANAARNPAAACREELTLDDYLAVEPTIGPFSALDDFTPGDVSAAVVVTSEERARALGRHEVVAEVVATAQSHNEPMTWFDDRVFATRRDGPVRHVADLLFEATGMAPSDVDVACLYDCSTLTFLHLLEEARLCERGGAAELVADPGSIGAGGVLPANTNGGDFAGGYSHGFRHLVEGARQVTGRAANQVDGAEVALVMGAPLGPTSGTVMRRRELR